MRHPKTIEDVTMGEIVWAAVRSILLVMVIGGPLVWLVLENIEPIQAFGNWLLEHLPDA